MFPELTRTETALARRIAMSEYCSDSNRIPNHQKWAEVSLGLGGLTQIDLCIDVDYNQLYAGDYGFHRAGWFLCDLRAQYLLDFFRRHPDQAASPLQLFFLENKKWMVRFKEKCTAQRIANVIEAAPRM